MSCVRRTRADTDIRHYQAQWQGQTRDSATRHSRDVFNPLEGAVHHNIIRTLIALLIKFVDCAKRKGIYVNKTQYLEAPTVLTLILMLLSAL